MHAFTRTLVAALAILALAAPVASARIDPPPSGPGASAQAPKPAAHPAAPASAKSDDDIPWLTIGFGVAGAFLLVSAAAAAVAVTRRPGRAGIA
jgi:hypothetical protein